MNSRQKSFTQPIRRPCFWTLCGSFCLALSLASCATNEMTQSQTSSVQKIDMHFDEEITHEKEEWVPLRGLMATPHTDLNKPDPNKLKEQYDDYAKRMRDRFNESVRKERADFYANERKVRDEFLAALNSERDNFYRSKPSPRALQEFSKNIEKKRSDYYARERLRSSSREEKIRSRQAGFAAYLSNQRIQFNSELQSYVKAFREAEKIKAEQKKAQDELKAKARTTSGLPAGLTPVPPEENPYFKELSDWDKIPKGEGKLLKAN